jgi:lysophospholipase L1-like esterase
MGINFIDSDRLDINLAPVLVIGGGNPSGVIDDTAGVGATDKTWSADKLAAEFAATGGSLPADDKYLVVKEGEYVDLFATATVGETTEILAFSDRRTDNLREESTTGSPYAFAETYQKALRGNHLEAVSFYTIAGASLTISCLLKTDLLNNPDVVLSDFTGASTIFIITPATTGTEKFKLDGTDAHVFINTDSPFFDTKTGRIQVPVNASLLVGTRGGPAAFRFSAFDDVAHPRFVFFNASGNKTSSYHSLCFAFYISGKKRGYLAPDLNRLETRLESLEHSSLFQVGYAGKKLSIIADSIWAYTGNVYPASNAVFYTGSNGGVQSVDQMCWAQLADALGLAVLAINAYSGSRVTGTAAGAVVNSGRALSLHIGADDPDVILIAIGINDFNAEVALGTYDPATNPPPAGTPTEFKAGYAQMLAQTLTRYPRAQVWCCTLLPCEKNGAAGYPEINDAGVPLFAYNTAIREIAGAFGCRIIDLDRCGITYFNRAEFMPDNLHPNSDGHSLMARQMIAQLLARA